MIFFAKDAATALKVAAALRAENISAFALYDPHTIDYHVYTHWVPIVNKRAWTPEGGPWCWAEYKPTYGQEACPRSLELLSRAVHLDVSPLLTDEDIEQILAGTERVLNALA